MVNTVNFGMLDPTLASDQVAIQRNMDLAAALRKAALTPVDTSGRMMGQIAYKISPLEGLAKLLQSRQASNIDDETDAQRTALAQRQSDLLGALVGGGSTNPSTASTAALTQGAIDGSTGPTNDNAQRLATILAQGSGAAPQGGGIGITGSPMRDRILMALNPDKYTESYLKRFDPTDATRMATAAGQDPRMANAAALLKANTAPGVLEQTQAGLTKDEIRQAAYAAAAKAGEVERRSGNQFDNFFTGASGQVPHMPPNVNPVGPIASNGAIPGGVTPMLGAIPAVQASAQAQSAGTANGGFQNVTTGTGATIPVRGSEIGAGGTLLPPQPGVQGNFQGDPSAVAASIATMTDPQERANAQAALAEQAKRTPGFAQGAPLQLGQSTANKTMQEVNAKMMTELPAQLAQSKQTVTGLENAYKTIDGLSKSGPGVSHAVDAIALVNNMGIPLLKGDVNGYQTLKKFLENSASTAAASNGFTGSDARFEQFKAGQPNAETMNPDALKGAIRYVLSQHDAAIARASYIQQQAQTNASDPNAVQKAAQQFSQTYNPRVFEFSRMTPDDRKAAVKAMNPQQLDQFKKQYGAAHEQGWVQ